MLPTIDLQDDAIVMVDQRKLPGQEIYVRCRTAPEVAKAIRTMVIRGQDVAGCRAMGGHGAAVVPDGARVLTHCNAGALATAGYGSALGVIRAAVEQGKKIAVFADETRPFLQGARLTAWELVRDGIPTTEITDTMAGALSGQNKVDLVAVGREPIAANGDTAKRIGTNKKPRLARRHRLPFDAA